MQSETYFADPSEAMPQIKARDAKQQPWWQRIDTLSPGTATSLGIAVGTFAALLTYLPKFRDFPDALCLFPVVLFGIAGYSLWLINEPTRADRLARIAMPIAIVVMIGLLVVFPSDLWRLVRTEPMLGMAMLGGVVSFCGGVVVVGWGLVHFLGYLASQPWRGARTGGVWDRELDVNP
jgi:hypothetical protein